MKIGILTLPLHTNYGGILQAYALQTVLERMGHEVEIIKWEKKIFTGFPFYKRPFIYAKRLLKHEELYREYREQQESCIVYEHLQESIDRMIHFSTQMIHNKMMLVEYCNKTQFDAIVVGSDQVWRKSYETKSFFEKFLPSNKFPNLDTYFLDFVSLLDRRPQLLAYAASFGVEYEELDKSEVEHYGNLAKRFDIISVREQQAVNMIQNAYKWREDISWVLDPTMLLSADDYKCLYSQAAIKPEKPYLLYYVLDSTLEKTSLMHLLARELSLNVISVSPNSQSGNIRERVLPSVETWLSYFLTADFVLTDSFHGMVFSILFKKPFYVMGNKKRGLARFTSLLEMLGLEDRLILNLSESVKLERNIDWNHVSRVLSDYRHKCVSILPNKSKE